MNALPANRASPWTIPVVVAVTLAGVAAVYLLGHTRAVRATRDYFEAQTGLSLPREAVVLKARDWSGRDPSLSFAWVVFSPSALELPPRGVKVIHEKMDFALVGGLAQCVKDMEWDLDGGRKIAQPQGAWGYTWEASGYKFYATLIRSSEGDYLMVLRGASGEELPGR